MTATSSGYGWNPDMPLPLQDKLKEDLKLALRTRHDALKSTIRQIMSEFFKLTVPVVLEGGKKSTRPKKAEEITNDDVIGIIQGLIKSERIVLEAKRKRAPNTCASSKATCPGRRRGRRSWHGSRPISTLGSIRTACRPWAPS